ncbi:molybdopterin-dependent oxidoreductase [Pelagimonas varians]|uniref:trimethylamine-N-oxide reductase n=1 Tax=Pelagimonas varians TaxID=696760 RepID=A0A238KY53_9RHOB|nr:molybdopterin-dependent oxidoreductase [Pelagimonas varians]PYG27858.1 trimethylamine-N-oxide reductase (cytochrome c) [Pelagimonas varians]SMX47745.1 Dimethyl sulfoxide/trimethylamine N-oxide reductase precursor [Pelagimonas varians]
MTQNTIHPTRRSILKGMTALGVSAAMIPAWLQQAQAMFQDGEIVNASHFGAGYFKIEGGRVVGIRPHEADYVANEMVESLSSWVNAADRVQYPMVRKGFLENGKDSDRTRRGQDEYVRVTWDEAYDLVASELTRVKEEHGNSSIFGGSYGWKTPGLMHHSFNNLYRLLNLHGGFVDDVNSYSTGAIRVIMPYALGGSYSNGTAWPKTIEKTELIVFWGSNPETTCRIGWSVPDHKGMKYLRDFKATGKPSIVVDPIHNATAKLLDSDWVAPRQGTDVAMMMGIAHTLLDEGLHDQDFLDEYTEGFDQFAVYLRGEEDGVVKSAEWASEICGVPADKLRDMARLMASKRTLIQMGWSIQRQHHGEQGPWMAFTLACMLGYVGLPGGGADFTMHYANSGTPKSNVPAFPGFSAGEGSKDMPAPIPVSRVPWVMGNPGAKYDYNGTEYTAPDLRLVYWAGGNPFHHHQERNQHLEYWHKPETIIVNELFWTATARHADIVLPVSTNLERNDMSMFGRSNNGLVAMKQVIEPMYESRTDYQIFTEIAKRLGYEDDYTEGLDEMGHLRNFYEKGRAKAAENGVDMPDFDTFWNDEPMQIFPTSKEAEEHVQFAKTREDPLLNPRGTPSGRFEIYSRKIADYNYDDCPAHPTWMEPIERLGGAMSDRYPLAVNSQHPVNRLHSQLNNTDLRHSYEVGGREPITMNPVDAEARGLKDGDIVRVFNDRGQVLAGLVISEEIAPDHVRICQGGWYDPAEPGVPGTLCKHGDVNVLMPDIGTSKLAQGNCGHTAQAEVEKYESDIPDLGIFKPIA